jgi:hypothetical protein
MFVIFATKPLYDGTKGFRFNFLGQKGADPQACLDQAWLEA